MKSTSLISQLHPVKQAIAGMLLVLFSGLPLLGIVGYWPDQMPAAGTPDGLYNFEWFKVTLIDKATHAPVPGEHTIHLSTLLLVLVALSGYLGNMIHVATSFTTYIGSRKFEKSWLLWYCVRPFSAAALAVALFFILRAGFLNYTNDSSNLNLYGVLAISMLTGLFTDIATQKLKEVFETIFKPKDARPDKLEDTNKASNEFAVTSVSPVKLKKNANNTILVYGENLLTQSINVLIGNTIVSQVVVKEKSIGFNYMPTANEMAQGHVLMVITTQNGKTLYAKKIAFE
jgi:hypothetical protein